ncbi:hypothetical protein L798_10506 [Zootermopsis nevadensis]|uniref:Uncharacterized protein n=1 Tax=Zootermopsis nevadensis TaxID=136037 RepID=A0A067QYW7_ZOONE|nr:hypothetical protein L798_10506 [Zootermopsis nevadensis]
MLQQDKQADQVGKEISAQAGELKKLYLRAERKVTEVARLKERLKKVQEERTRFQAQGAHIS